MNKPVWKIFLCVLCIAHLKTVILYFIFIFKCHYFYSCIYLLYLNYLKWFYQGILCMMHFANFSDYIIVSVWYNCIDSFVQDSPTDSNQLLNRCFQSPCISREDGTSRHVVADVARPEKLFFRPGESQGSVRGRETAWCCHPQVRSVGLVSAQSLNDGHLRHMSLW